MNAEIFYAAGQENLVSEIKKELCKCVYPFRSIELNEIGAQGSNFERYSKLIHASILPAHGISLYLKEMESMIYDFYINVYYKLSSSGVLPIRDLECFFPAVAIRDRMVLVPNGLGNVAKGILFVDNIFLPMESGGLFEVNYYNQLEIKNRLYQIGESIRSEFLRDLKMYARYQNIQDISLPKLAQDLSVGLDFIMYIISMGATVGTCYNQLTCEFSVDKVQLNRWTKLVLTIENHSEIDIKDLGIQIE